ncbi:MAG: hypothetical protein CR967_01665 [Proteobacteria bacterium]|nr:MAG: hypothetical protein CR967_01665 [Pseudomonadota bacterium]
MKKLVVASLFVASSLFAHTILMSCFENGDGTVTCEGGFSDGSGASGVKIQVLKDGKVLIEAKMNEDSEYTFKKPKGDYKVLLKSGVGHEATIPSKEITE